MSEYFKSIKNENNSDHIDEFCNCSGIVVAYSDEFHTDYFDVRWIPSNLKYGYNNSQLVLDYQYYRDNKIDSILE